MGKSDAADHLEFALRRLWRRLLRPARPDPMAQNQTSNRAQKGTGVRVTDVMFSVADPAPRGDRVVSAEPKFECSVYIVWKTRKK